MTALRLASTVFLSTVLCFAQARAQSAVEMTADPTHRLVLQNRYVRVFQVDVAPRSATLLHLHHHDYTFVTLGVAEVSNEVEGKNPVTLKLQDGETGFLAGNFAHLARNLSTSPLRSLIIEFLLDDSERNAPGRWDEDRALHILHGGTEEILFAKDGARASKVELQTAGIDPGRKSGPQLLLAVSDLVLRGDFSGTGASNLGMKSGDVKWFPHGLNHRATNVGTQTARYVVLEFQE